MARPRAQIPCPRDAIGLGLDEAATFIGISATLFTRLVGEGDLPAPRVIAGRRIWDADEIIAAFKRFPHAQVDLPRGVVSRHDDGPKADSGWGDAWA